jgi:peptide deformylase
MTVRKVVEYPDPILRTISSKITVFDDQLQFLIDDMFETMDAYNGIGLAAPQIGLSKSVLVVGYKKLRFPLINPRIVESHGFSINQEGCLSLPSIHVDVERKDKIKVASKTVNGDDIEQEFSGFLAVIVQHELDHLNGKLIIDYGTPKVSLKEVD